MPYSSTAEIYFIAAMFVLIFIVCGAACYFFIKTYKQEKKAKEENLRQKELDRKNAAAEVVETSITD